MGQTAFPSSINALSAMVNARRRWAASTYEEVGPLNPTKTSRRSTHEDIGPLDPRNVDRSVRVGGDSWVVRSDRRQSHIPCAQGGSGIILTLMRPESHCPLGERSDR